MFKQCIRLFSQTGRVLPVQLTDILCSPQYEVIELDLLARQRKTELSETVGQRIRIVDLIACQLHLYLLIRLLILRNLGKAWTCVEMMKCDFGFSSSR